MISNILLCQSLVGLGQPAFIIAEIGLAHEGSLGIAHAFIDSAYRAGANAVKFQTHLPEFESSALEQFRIKVFPQDKTRFDYWRRTAFSLEQWQELKNHASSLGLPFLSTPFSIEAAHLLKSIGVDGWKISSGDTNNLPLLEEIASFSQPILLSTGMSFLEEIDDAVKLIKQSGCPLILFQCTNRYPCPPEKIGLNLIAHYSQRYDCLVGLSDHSGRPATSLAAVVMGAKAIEVHVTWHREFFGPDVTSSVTLEEFKTLVTDIRFIEKALNNPVAKNEEAQALNETRKLFTKSIVLNKKLEAGHEMSRDDISFRKPGSGVPANQYRDVLGKVLKKELPEGHFLRWIDLAPEGNHEDSTR